MILLPIIIPAAYILDLLLGDPRRMPHPVRLMGWFISLLERLLRTGRPNADLAAGTLVAALLPLSAWLLTYYLLSIIDAHLGRAAWIAASVLLAWTTISVKGLADGARDVYLPLIRGDLPEARRKLGMIVGRDTEGLGEHDIARGAVESVAENASDGVVAPLLYLAIGGVPLAMAYKAINTMDSMLGYKNERYLYFGRAAARLDDAANFLPARLTALFMVAAAAALEAFGRPFSWRDSLRVFVRDKGKHASPNSGHPEAAAAGALGVRLGGENSYFGVKGVKPYIGDPDAELDAGKIKDAVTLLHAASALAMFFSFFLSAALSLAVYGPVGSLFCH